MRIKPSSSGVYLPQAGIARHLAAVGEATEVPRGSPSRGPPYWKSRVLRRQALGDEDGCHSGGPSGGDLVRSLVRTKLR
jgi:hypothetical protein